MTYADFSRGSITSSLHTKKEISEFGNGHRSKPVREQERKSHDTFFITRKQHQKENTILLETSLAVASDSVREIWRIPQEQVTKG